MHPHGFIGPSCTVELLRYPSCRFIYWAAWGSYKWTEAYDVGDEASHGDTWWQCKHWLYLRPTQWCNTCDTIAITQTASWCNHGTIPWEGIETTHFLWGPLALCPLTSSCVVLSSFLIRSCLHTYYKPSVYCPLHLWIPYTHTYHYIIPYTNQLPLECP